MEASISACRSNVRQLAEILPIFTIYWLSGDGQQLLCLRGHLALQRGGGCVLWR